MPPTPAANANLPPAMTESQMRSTAASQIDLEISQGVAPIQSQINTTQARETKALGQIGGMFDALQPVVQQAATSVTQAYNEATAQEQSVFANAQAQIQANRGNRAADAQAMAQLTGGPVAIGDWTQPWDNASTDLAQLGAGQQLHTLAYAQAGEQQAQQFAGQVFPLIRTEQMASARNTFEEQIREYQEQITALKSQRGAQVNKRYNELRTQELEYGLSRATYQLQKLDSQRDYNFKVKEAKAQKVEADRQYKMDRQQLDHQIAKDRNDYQLQKRALGQDDKRIALLEKEWDLKYEQYLTDKEALTGTVDGKKTLEQKTLDAQIQRDADLLDLSKQELREKKHEFKVNAKNVKATTEANQATLWNDLLENAVNPQPGKTYTETEKKEILPKDALSVINPVEGVYTEVDKKGKVHYFVDKQVTHTVPNNFQPLRDPNKLVDYLVTGMNDPKNYGRAWAVNLIKTKFPDLEGWKYGDKWPPEKVKKQLAAHPDRPGIGSPDDLFEFPDWLTAVPGAGAAPLTTGTAPPTTPKVGAAWNKKQDPVDTYAGDTIITKSGAHVKNGKYVSV